MRMSKAVTALAEGSPMCSTCQRRAIRLLSWSCDLHLFVGTWAFREARGPCNSRGGWAAHDLSWQALSLSGGMPAFRPPGQCEQSVHGQRYQALISRRWRRNRRRTSLL